jgi:hypothetical protein
MHSPNYHLPINLFLSVPTHITTDLASASIPPFSSFHGNPLQALYLPRHFAHYSRPIGFPLIPETSVHEIRLQDEQRKVPYERDGVEEICIAAASV